jgi:hypothetical protein
MFSWARMYVTRGWCAAVAIAAISSFGAASCGGGGGGGSDTSASGIVTRPSNAGASTVVDQLVEMQTLTGELLDQTTTDGAGRYTVEAADTGTQRIVVPNANAATASNPQPSGPPIRLEALVVPQPGNEVGKSVDGATTIGSVAADISLRAGRTRAEDFTPERIGNLEGAALPLEPQTDFTDSDAVIRTASVVNDLTGDGAHVAPGTPPLGPARR